MSLAFETAAVLARMIRGKEISSLELTEYYIGRIEKHDERVNAVVVRDFDRARKAAIEADAALARGERQGPLHGVPMTIKESYDLEGTPTTWGIPAFADNVATSDAETVMRLKAAGAHFLGKTNVPVDLSDFQSYNEIYGTTNNPWNTGCTPGGSSGGSAAALAAGLCALESGSDIGGSIRNPAHFCGVYGHKPTWGIIPDQGHGLPAAAAPPDIAVVGPLARSAEDLALCLDVVAGADPFQSPGWKLELPRAEKRSLSEYRVAFWQDDEHCPVSRETADRVQRVADCLAAKGAQVSDTARPEIHVTRSHETYLHLLNGVMSAALPKAEFERTKELVRTLDPDDRSTGATMARAAVQDHSQWVRVHHRRFRLRRAWRAFFDEWDILVCPQMPTAAFPHDHSPTDARTVRVDDADLAYFDQLFWSGLITAAHLPSTVFPTGPSALGLPIGLQAVGAEFQDHVCIDFARLLADEIGGFVPPPGYDD